MRRQHRISYRCVLVILLALLSCTAITAANPIPIPPHPQPQVPGSIPGQELSIGWIMLIFIVDFFLDTLLLYAGVLLLGRFKLLMPHEVFHLPKTRFFLAVLIISLVGLSSEWILGSTIIGLFVTLCCVFLSFCLVSRYLFRITWRNALYLGGFASIVNLLFWIVLFNV